MNDVKSIYFRVKLKGFGIVNFDSPDQRFLYNTLGDGYQRVAADRENVNFGKKRWYKKGDKTTFRLTISSDCLKKALYENDIPHQTVNLNRYDELNLNFLASAVALLRGWLNPSGDNASKRKSGITLLDAQQTCSAIPTLEVYSVDSKKESIEDLKTNTFYQKEAVGDIEYESRGCIRLSDLQFLSTDDIFDRLGINPDLYEAYVKILSTKMPTRTNLGYYQMYGSEVLIPEYGIFFEYESVLFLVKKFLRDLMGLRIQRNRAYAEVVAIEYKLVHNSLEDLLSDDNGFKPLTLDELDNLSFSMHHFYEPYDKEKAEALRDMMDKADVKAIEEAKRKKEEAKRKRAEAKKNKNKPAGEVSDTAETEQPD